MRTRGHVLLRIASVVALFALTSALAHVQEGQSADRFLVSEVMIPMRDGVRLHTKIFTPKNQTESLPLIMNRTPYGVDGAATNFVTYLEALAAEGYIFVFQDVRGLDPVWWTSPERWVRCPQWQRHAADGRVGDSRMNSSSKPSA